MVIELEARQEKSARIVKYIRSNIFCKAQMILVAYISFPKVYPNSFKKINLG